jgi:hypothetical protein
MFKYCLIQPGQAAILTHELDLKDLEQKRKKGTKDSVNSDSMPFLEKTPMPSF